MKVYPLFFRYLIPVRGAGFRVDVCAEGRVVARQEDSGYWLDAVEPATLAEGGATLVEANAKFRATFYSVLFDIAAETASYDEFRKVVTDFFNTVDAVDERHWGDARAAIRAGSITFPDFDLQRESGERAIGIQFQRLDMPAKMTYLADQNQLDELAEAA